jgi:hypothetical protein
VVADWFWVGTQPKELGCMVPVRRSVHPVQLVLSESSSPIFKLKVRMGLYLGADADTWLLNTGRRGKSVDLKINMDRSPGKRC